MTDPANLTFTTKPNLREIIRDTVADALRDRRTAAPELMSAEELEKRVRMRAGTFRNWVLHGCPHLRDGRKLRFREPDMLRWLEERHGGAKQERRRW
jgi:hypothetical protein